MMYRNVWYMMIGEVIDNLIEGLCERTEHLDIFFSAHHSMMIYFQFSICWWKVSVIF